MPVTHHNKKKFPVLPVSIFLAVFGGMIWYGYTHFIKTKTPTESVTTGLNSKLPIATETKPLNKLEQYMKAERDSAAKNEQRNNDPYSQKDTGKTISLHKYKPRNAFAVLETTPDKNLLQADQKINEQIAAIYKTIHQRPTKQNEHVSYTDSLIVPTQPIRKAEKTDPELKQLEGMLDKLIEIQHPEIVKQRMVQKDSSKTYLASTTIKTSVTAVVHNTQVVTNGSTIKLRLTQDLVLGGQRIPKGSFVFGNCTLTNERLTVQLTNLEYQNTVIPVNLVVYDVDGIAGIYIPGAISRDVSKEGTDQAIQSFNLNSYDPSITGQVANAGLQATKSLLSKKVKLVRVTVKAGHHILLQNEHS